MANVLEYIPEVNKYEVRSRYSVHFLTNTLEKVIEPPYSVGIG